MLWFSCTCIIHGIMITALPGGGYFGLHCIDVIPGTFDAILRVFLVQSEGDAIDAFLRLVCFIVDCRGSMKS